LPPAPGPQMPVIVNAGSAGQPALDEMSGLDVQKTALNGAQVMALQGIVQSVVLGQLPRASGVEMIAAAFPLSLEQAEKIMGTAGASFEPTVAASEPSALTGGQARSARLEEVRSSSRLARVSRNYAAMVREQGTCKRTVALPLLRTMLEHDLEALRHWESQRTDALRSSGVLPQLAVVRCAPAPSIPDLRKRPVWLTDDRAMPALDDVIEFRVVSTKDGETTTTKIALPDWRDFLPNLNSSHASWFKAAAVRVANAELDALSHQKRSMRSAVGLHVEKRDLVSDLFSIEDSRIIDALANRQQKIVTIPETIQGLAREAIAQGIEQGATSAELNKSLTTLFADLEDWEAMRISTTEASACSSQASWWAMGDVGTSKKGWLQSSFGPGMRAEHTANMDQGAIPFNRAFSTGQMYPHDPDYDDPALDINCTCVVTAEEFEPLGDEE